MPTAMHWYNMAAKRWGKVDPKDDEAVTKFFTHTMSTLPDKKRQAVMSYLLAHDGPSRIPMTCKCSSCVYRRKLYEKKEK